MAIDHALLERVQAGGPPVLRFYRWQPACLSLGRNQPADVETAVLQQRGAGLVRRPTGGMAVLHDRELTYSVVVPVGILGSPRQAYRLINEALLTGLQALGARVAVAATGSAAHRYPSCFAEPAAGELLADARKLVGSAQRCERRTLLQHGSILLENDQSELSVLFPSQPSAESAICLEQLLGVLPPPGELARALADGFSARLGIALAPGTLAPDTLERARQLRTFYASPEWTWRV